MVAVASHVIEGHVRRGFEGVRDAFEGNFTRRGELGGACCAYIRGEKVVDLWGGVRNQLTGDPWERDTMVVIHSATKGLAAMTLAIEVQFSLGFAKSCDNWRFGSSSRAFGAPGAGGSMGFADPDTGLGYGYVTSRMGTTFTGDPRDVALREAIDSVLRK
jgi:CubicO group peptidase (beta-lactamase class C family)